jgi:cell division protease FtsH
VLDALVEELLEKETLDKAQVAQIFEPLRRREIRPAWTGSETRVPSTVPPVKSSTNGRAPEAGVVIGPDSGPDAPPPGDPADES